MSFCSLDEAFEKNTINETIKLFEKSPLNFKPSDYSTNNEGAFEYKPLEQSGFSASEYMTYTPEPVKTNPKQRFLKNTTIAHLHDNDDFKQYSINPRHKVTSNDEEISPPTENSVEDNKPYPVERFGQSKSRIDVEKLYEDENNKSKNIINSLINKHKREIAKEREKIISLNYTNIIKYLNKHPSTRAKVLEYYNRNLPDTSNKLISSSTAELLTVVGIGVMLIIVMDLVVRSSK
jgi:hypothetical protein